MNKLKKYSKTILVLSVLSLIALFFSHLALTNINHGEANLSLEWTILRIAALIFLAFIISSIFTIREVFKIG